MRYCGPTCHTLVQSGRCPACQAKREQHKARAYDEQRGSAASRGYDARWRKYRAWFLRQWPLCGDRPSKAPSTTDSRCRADGRIVPAHVVDHIVPVTGPEDESFFRPVGQQSLCETCHNAKRQREARQAVQARQQRGAA